MPLRGVLGSDVLAHRPDWQVIQNPFAAEPDEIVLIPAIAPDIAVFHAVMADAEGNVWVGRRRELATLAHAAKRTLVTVERIVEGNLLEDERLAPGTISATYIEAVAVAEHGAWPIALLDEYGADPAHISAYARAARTEAGFQRLSRPARLPPPGGRRVIQPEERLAAAIAAPHPRPGRPAGPPHRRRRREPDPGRRLLAGAQAGPPRPALAAASREPAIRSPKARASCSTWRARAGSTCSSSAAARSTGRPTST